MNNQHRKLAFVVCVTMALLLGLSTESLAGFMRAIGALFAGISAGLFIRPVFDAKEGLDTKRPHL